MALRHLHALYESSSRETPAMSIEPPGGLSPPILERSNGLMLWYSECRVCKNRFTIQAELSTVCCCLCLGVVHYPFLGVEEGRPFLSYAIERIDPHAHPSLRFFNGTMVACLSKIRVLEWAIGIPI